MTRPLGVRFPNPAPKFPSDYIRHLPHLDNNPCASIAYIRYLLVMKKRYAATRKVRAFIAAQPDEVPAKPGHKAMKQMRAAHEKQAAAIRAKPSYQRVSDDFDLEYDVARQMQTARTVAGLTQAELARRMNTTQSVVSRIESGSNISIETLTRYAEACGSRLHVQIVREPVAPYGKK